MNDPGAFEMIQNSAGGTVPAMHGAMDIPIQTNLYVLSMDINLCTVYNSKFSQKKRNNMNKRIVHLIIDNFTALRISVMSSNHFALAREHLFSHLNYFLNAHKFVERTDAEMKVSPVLMKNYFLIQSFCHSFTYFNQ